MNENHLISKKQICCACANEIERCPCIWSAVRELQKNIKECCDAKMVYRLESSVCVLKHATEEAVNQLEARTSAIETQIVGLLRDKTIEKFNLPTVKSLNEITEIEILKSCIEGKNKTIFEMDQLIKKLQSEINFLRALNDSEENKSSGCHP